MNGYLLKAETEEGRVSLKRAKLCFCSSVTRLNVKPKHEHLGQRQRENQSLFCRQHNDSVTIERVYLCQGLMVEQFSDVMESPCEDTTEETML